MAAPARLVRNLQSTLGDQTADDLVEWMHAMDRSRIELREFNELNFARFDHRVGEQRHWMEARFAEFTRSFEAQLQDVRTELRGEMHAGFAGLRREMDAGFNELRTSVSNVEALVERRFADLLKWSFGFWIATFIGVAALVR